MIKHLIFDFDGVIVDSEILAARAFVKILSDMNINYTEENFAENFAGNKIVNVIESLSIKHNIGDKNIFLNKLMKLVGNVFFKDLKAVKNVKKFLQTNKLDRYIGSNSGKQRIVKGLKFVDLNHLFEKNKIYTFEMVKKPKPSPDIYLKIIEENKLNQKEVLIIEDSVAGVIAARSAKIKVIGMTAGQHWKNRSSQTLLDSGAIFTAHSFDDLKGLLLRI